MVVVDPLFELRSEVLNWIQIWTIGWPIHHWYTLIFEPFLDLVGSMDRGVILHKCHTRLSCSRQLVVENCEIGVGSILTSLRQGPSPLYHI